MINKIIQIEYESGQQDIDTICRKHGVDKSSLDWYIPPPSLNDIVDLDVCPPILTIPDGAMPGIIDKLPTHFDVSSLGRNHVLPKVDTPTDTKLAKIGSIRDLILEEAHSKMLECRLGNIDLNTKELKEVEALTTSIESSIKPKKEATGTTINILVQKLMDRTLDDC